jgi:peptidoglycan/xylan/chitin deacetylase (PgdA/CDA1 family)
MTPRWLDADIATGLDSLRRALDREPVLHRPPYGIYSPWGLRTVHRAGLRPLLWSRWGKDWRGDATPERIAALAAQGAVPGDVILLHDADFYSAPGCHLRTVKALEQILSILRSRGIATVLPV